MAMTPLGASPSRADPANFATRSDTLLGALPNFVTEANVLQADVNAKQLLTATASSVATAAAATVAVAANAIAWVSGTTYAIGDARYSPVSFQTYRRRTAGAGTTDPSADATNWKLVVQVGEAFAAVTATAVSTTLTSTDLGSLIKVTATAATVTLVAVASAPAGSIVTVMAEFASGATIIKGSGAEVISNAFAVSSNTFTLAAGESIQLVSNGASWDTINYQALNFPSLNGGQLAGLRNRIINGDMRIDQRNNGAAVTSLGGLLYMLDRWQVFMSQPSKLTIQQVADAPAGFKYSTKITVASQYSPLAADYFGIAQWIEGQNIIDFGLGTASPANITVSLWVKSSVPGVYAVCLGNGGLTRGYLGQVSVTASWAKQTVTLTGDTAGTWATDNTGGMRLSFNLGDGSNYLGVAGWQSGSLGYASTSSLAFVNQVAGSTLNITGVQLELGSVATPFEQRPIGLELSLCQRYYETTGGTRTEEAIALVPVRGDFVPLNIRYLAVKRTIPSVIIYAAGSGVAGAIRQLDGSGAPANISATISSTTSELTLINAAFQTSSHYGFNFTASAEL